MATKIKIPFDIFYFECPTPFKYGSSFHSNINWFKSGRNVGVSIPEYKEELLRIINGFKENTSGSPRKYIDNTKKIISEFYDNKNIPEGQP